ncbi:oxidoreductase, partial [Staphylococcus hominis]
IADRDADAGRACLKEWALPERAAFQRADVASERSVQALVKATLKRFGRIDGLVNNAGIASAHGTPLAEMTLAE